MLASELVPQPAPCEPRTPASVCVLVVEDEPVQRELLVHSLEKQGYRTIAAARGEAAAEAARRERPDLVILDLRLPDCDGLQLCAQLTDDPATCHIPVIVISGWDRPDIVRQARAAGCRYFLHKPYDPNALLVLIERTMGEEASGGWL